MSIIKRPAYDCDTLPYWCDDSQYEDVEKSFGRFIDNNRGYEITDPNTPRPWLNYLCNDKIATAISNTGTGFLWYKSSLFRITKYDHPIDYLPREFKDGREIIVEDLGSGKTYNVFREYDEINCVHRPGYSTITATFGTLKVSILIFVPLVDACECWIVSFENTGDDAKKLKVTMNQTWTIAKFGIHTADDGIPYLSTPGDKLTVKTNANGVIAHSDNKELPVELWACFQSPQAQESFNKIDEMQHKDGRTFKFQIPNICCDLDLPAGQTKELHVISGVEIEEDLFNEMLEKYKSVSAFNKELAKVQDNWDSLIDGISCDIPDENMEKFLNIWFKHQLYLTYRYVRSGYVGYRDSLQDTWGYILIEPDITRDKLLTILSHMKKDGSCPRNFSPFGIDDTHDLRNFMDSATWIGMCLTDYIKETGDFDILKTQIRYLDDTKLDTVENHIWKAFDLLYSSRGLHGLCLIGDGDWNDGIEGISKQGPAVSVWLTMATFHAQNLLADMYAFMSDTKKENILRERSIVLKDCINENAWDGDWYVYAFSGKGNPIGSHTNKEGKIHLNSNTWAVFTGITDQERTIKVMNSIKEHLDTPLGPALLHPPYVNEGHEVGRIAKLEPGTFENGSVYKHAVSFKVFADLVAGDYEQAYKTFINILPSSPANFDTRRTSEPYVLGNYYCGPTHKRYGQNFFSWFTGSPAWLLRAGFDQILGVKADWEGLKISPKVPADWNEYSMKRVFRNTEYDVSFIRVASPKMAGIWVDGDKIDGDLICATKKGKVSVMVKYN